MVTLEIIPHSGETRRAQVEKYDIEDAIKLNEQINSNEVMTVRIGRIIMSRINIREVNPVEEEPPGGTGEQTEPTEQR